MNEPLKTYPLAVVLSATTGRLVCDIGDFYGILNHVTGDSLFTHVLPRALRFAAPLIEAEFPELKSANTPESHALLTGMVEAAKIDADSTVDAACASWVRLMEGGGGLAREYAIESHADKWLSLDPVEELEAKVGKDKVIVV